MLQEQIKCYQELRGAPFESWYNILLLPNTSAGGEILMLPIIKRCLIHLNPAAILKCYPIQVLQKHQGQ